MAVPTSVVTNSGSAVETCSKSSVSAWIGNKPVGRLRVKVRVVVKPPKASVSVRVVANTPLVEDALGWTVEGAAPIVVVGDTFRAGTVSLDVSVALPRDSVMIVPTSEVGAATAENREMALV